jgi:hypothetical protein
MGSPFSALNPTAQFGMPVGAVRSDLRGLPTSSASTADHVETPWHPDSGAFWLVGLILATAAGIAGASVRLHAGPARAGASIGKA